MAGLYRAGIHLQAFPDHTKSFDWDVRGYFRFNEHGVFAGTAAGHKATAQDDEGKPTLHQPRPNTSFSTHPFPHSFNSSALHNSG